MPKIIDDFKAEVAASGALGNRTDQRQKLNRIAEKYLIEMKEKYSLNTVKNYLATMRKFVAAETEAGEKHPAMQMLKLDSQEYYQMNKEYAEKVRQRSKSPFENINVEAFVKTCEDLIEGYHRTHISFVKLALGLAGLTGRRLYSEVLGFGKISLIDDPDQPGRMDHVIFAGQAKVKGDGVKPAYEIPVLSDAEFVCDGWNLLRAEKPAIPDDLTGYEILPNDLKSLTVNVHQTGFDDYQRLFLTHREDLKELSNWCAKRAHTAAAKNSKKIFEEFGLQKAHDLRAIYAECCFKVFQPGGDRNNYFSEILGHNENDLMTAQSYKTFRNERGQA